MTEEDVPSPRANGVGNVTEVLLMFVDTTFKPVRSLVFLVFLPHSPFPHPLGVIQSCCLSVNSGTSPLLSDMAWQ